MQPANKSESVTGFDKLVIASNNYLTLKANSWPKITLKVASYILSAGIFPLLAALVIYGNDYLIARKVTFFKNKAKGGLEEALLVCKEKNIVKLPEQNRLQIALAVAETIGNNLQAFYKSRIEQSFKSWSEAFNLTSQQRSVLASKLDQVASRHQDFAKERGQFWQLLGDRFQLSEEERLKFLVHQAKTNNPVPHQYVSVSEKIALFSHHILNWKPDQGFGTIEMLLNAYPLDPEQLFPIVEELLEQNWGLYEHYIVTKFGFTELQKTELAKICIDGFISQSSNSPPLVIESTAKGIINRITTTTLNVFGLTDSASKKELLQKFVPHARKHAGLNDYLSKQPEAFRPSGL